jgi:hypothetical protein
VPSLFSLTKRHNFVHPLIFHLIFHQIAWVSDHVADPDSRDESMQSWEPSRPNSKKGSRRPAGQKTAPKPIVVKPLVDKQDASDSIDQTQELPPSVSTTKNRKQPRTAKKKPKVDRPSAHVVTADEAADQMYTAKSEL